VRGLVLLFCSFLVAFGAVIHNGEVEVVLIQKDRAKSLFVGEKGSEWLAHPTDDSLVFTIVSAHYRQKNGINLQNGEEHLFFRLEKQKYHTEILRVEPSRIHYSQDKARRISREYKEAVAIYAHANRQILFNEPFLLPLNSFITSKYGGARTYNGVLRSFHGGTDFRAPVGTKIVSTNRGVVRLAKERFLSGGTVIVDHGGGIFSKYFHLSKIVVKPGDVVERGQLLAYSGNTGRSSGPHLHFGISVGSSDINPLDFVEKINKLFVREELAKMHFQSLKSGVLVADLGVVERGGAGGGLNLASVKKGVERVGEADVNLAGDVVAKNAGSKAELKVEAITGKIESVEGAETRISEVVEVKGDVAKALGGKVAKHTKSTFDKVKKVEVEAASADDHANVANEVAEDVSGEISVAENGDAGGAGKVNKSVKTVNLVSVETEEEAKARESEKLALKAAMRSNQFNKARPKKVDMKTTSLFEDEELTLKQDEKEPNSRSYKNRVVKYF